MARLIALIGNRTDLSPRVLAAERDALRVRGRGQPLGWGLGFYQGDEVLMRRRPLDEGEGVDLPALAADVRADLLVAHVRSATVGALRTENTHPFRFRHWLFAQTGTLPMFEEVRDRLMEGLPEFLRAQVRGETDAEVLFHVFLSFLHDRGAIDAASPGQVRDALRSSLAVIAATSAEVGAEPARINCLLSSPSAVYAVHAGAPMAFRVFAGRADVEALIGDDQALRRKIPEADRVRFVLLASDFDDEGMLTASSPLAVPRWKGVQERAILTLTRDRDPEAEAL